MATTIRIKKSGATGNIPAANSLDYGELALNYADGKLYYKDSDGQVQALSKQNTFETINANGTLIIADANTDILTLTPGDSIYITGDGLTDTITIGVKLDNTTSCTSSIIAATASAVKAAYDAAVNAFNKANSGANTVAVTAGGFNLTNAKLNFVNTASILVTAEEYLGNANISMTAIASTPLANDTFFSQGNTAAAATANVANALYALSTQIFTQANSAYGQANAAYGQANAAYAQANLAYTAANNSNLLSGGSITGNLTISGNLVVQGNATIIEVSNLSVNDSIILLSANATGDVGDIGFVGHFDRGNTATHAGIVRIHQLNEFQIFDNYELEPANNIIDINNYNYRLGNLRLNTINANSILMLGNVVATQANLTLAHNQANAAYGQANNAYGQANLAYGQANAAYTQANDAYTAANNRVLKAGDTMTGQLNISSGGLLVTGDANFDAGTLFVDSVANEIGIGTTTPTAKLDIVDSVNDTEVLRVRSSGGNSGSVKGKAHLGLHYFSTGNNSPVRISVEEVDNADFRGHLLFSTRSTEDDTAPTERMRIDANGSVGIGTTAPTSNLHVIGSANITSNVIVNGGTLFVDSVGNKVGIGSTTPTQELDVSGNVRLFSTGNVTLTLEADTDNVNESDNPKIIFKQDSGLVNSRIGYKTGFNDFEIYNEYAGEMHFGTANTLRVIINETGNVGIGTLTPTANLQVSGSVIVDGGVGVASSGTLHLRQKGDTLNDGMAITSSNAIAHRIWKDASGTFNLGPSSLPSTFTSTLTGNVGIGTASPTQILDVTGSTPKIAITNSGVRRYSLGVTSTSLIVTDESATSERMRIDATGNVGIGTSTPLEKLDVLGNVRIQNGNSLRLLTTTGSERGTIYATQATGALTAGLVIETSGDEEIVFKDAGEINMVIQGTGATGNGRSNVGIGTTSPTSKLHVVGNANITLGINTTTINANSLSVFTTNNDIFIQDITSGTSSTDAGIFIRNKLATLNSALFTEVSGQILSYGINITQLDTPRDTSRVGGIFRLDTRTGSFGDGECFVVKAQLANGNTELNRIVINLANGDTSLVPSNGNVGIGTTNATEKLHVLGNYFLLRNSADAGGGIVIDTGSTAPQNSQILLRDRNVDKWAIRKTTANNFDIYGSTIASPALTILDANGNVGIGNTAPAAKVVVEYTANNFAAGIDIRNTNASSTTQSVLDLTTNDGTFRVGKGSTAGGGLGFLYMGTADPMTFATNAAERMRILADGNVAIGTSTADQKFVVNGVIQAATTGNNGDLYLGGANVSIRSAYSSNVMGLYTTNSERMRIAANGWVGIGTSSPLQQLHVVGSIHSSNGSTASNTARNTGFRLWNDDAFGMDLHFGSGSQSTSWATAIYGRTTDTAAVRIGAYPPSSTAQNTMVEYVTVLNTGNVGIGATNPAYKLDVSGDIRATGNVLVGTGAGTQGGDNNLIRPTNTNSFLNIKGGAGRAKFVLGNDGVVIASGTTDQIAFHTNAAATTTGDERMRIDLGGNVMIGTTSTTSKLHVHGTSNRKVEIDFDNTRVVANGLMSIAYGDNALIKSLLLDNLSTGAVADHGSAIQWRLATNAAATAISAGQISVAKELLWTSTASTQNSYMSFGTTNSGVFNERVRINSNGNFGIGTTNPSQKLHVVGSTLITQDLIINGNLFVEGNTTTFNVATLEVEDNEIILNSNTAGAPSLNAFITIDRGSSTNTFLIWNETTDKWGWTDNGTTIYTFDTALSAYGQANNAYGQANAAYTQANSAFTAANNRVLKAGDTMTGQLNISSGGLLVTGNSNFDSGTLFVDSVNDRIGIGTTTPTAQVTINATNSTKLNFLAAGTERGYIDWTDSTSLLRIDSDAALALNSNNIERMRIDASGNVAIGTTSPLANLHIGSTAGTGLREIRLENANARIQMGVVGGGSDFVSTSSAGDFVLTNYSGANSIIFGIGTTERMRLSNTGSVGIGTTSPSYTLSVVNNAANQLYLRGGSTGYTQAGIILASNTTNTPESRGLGTYMFNEGTDTTFYMGTFYGSANTWGIGVAGGTTLQVEAADVSNAKFVVTNTGNVGIGTTSPTNARLHLYGSGSYDATLRLQSTGSSGGDAFILATDTSWTAGAGKLVFGLGGSPASALVRMTIDSTGNVGIGTSTTTNKLHVVGDLKSNNAVLHSSAVAAQLRLKSADSTSGYGLIHRHDGSDYYLLLTALNDADGSWSGLRPFSIQLSSGNMYLGNTSLNIIHGATTGSGNVGIGSTTPVVKLDVVGTNATDQFRVGNSLGSTDLRIRIDENSGAIINSAEGASTRYLVFQSGGSETMRIDPAGNVSIGTNSTTYKLQVNGNFAATTKSFLIDHPTKPGKKLRYGSLEGPENGVYVRGELKQSKIIELPDYWEGLVDETTITVNLTPIGKFQKLCVKEVRDNKVYLATENWLSDIHCYYTVFAERKDVEKLQVEI